MRFFILFLGVVFGVGSANCQKANYKDQTNQLGYAPHGPIRNMVLVYDGGKHRKEWTTERFKPYVYAPRENGKGADWVFDGFLFLEIFNGDGVGFASGYRPTPATKQDWINLLDQYFAPGRSIVALNTCIEDAKKICGKLPNRRKIVLSLPEPIPNQKNWGELNGKQLDFSKDEDRILACEWYIGCIKDRFKQAKLKNVELSGFYWLAEEATNTRTFVKDIASYIHKGKERFYWIPYFKSDGYETWKELGFDQAYLQPNHFFNNAIPDSRIDDACATARKYGMSLEVEFDDRAKGNPKLAARMRTYIDGFERNGVFKETDVAYYVGDDGVNTLWNGSPADRELYYYLVNKIINK